MASTQGLHVSELRRCYHCRLESTDSSFKYFDNKKVDQPRFECHHCHKLFTEGLHRRPQGKTYAKNRNEDPPELKGLSRQCRHCGVADNAVFKYYNNKNLSQPRFKCLGCGKQFQMRVLGIGEERRLVTSSEQRSAPRRRKLGVPDPFPNASNSSDKGSYQPCDGSFMPVPYDPLMPLEPGARLLWQEMSDEDAQYSNFREAELAEEENTEADPLSRTGNGDNGNLLPPLSGEDADYSDFLEVELLAEENNEAPNADAFSPTANVDDMLPPSWSNEDAELMDSVANVDDALPPSWSCEDAELMGFIEAGMRDYEAPDADMVSDSMAAEMVSESTSYDAEVMYGTLMVERPAATDSDSWSHNETSVDSSSMSYADAAAACCRQMDMEMAMARGNSMLPVAY